MNRPTLTEAQKNFILDNRESMNIDQLTQGAFDDPRLDRHSPEGKLVRAFLAGEDKVDQIKGEIPASTFILTEEHKKKIGELVGRVSSSVELAKLVIGNPTIKTFSHEWRAVYIYAKEFYPDSFSVNEEEPVAEKEYHPPDKLQGLCKLLNWAVTMGEKDQKAYLWGSLKGSQERQMKALMRYVRVFRFKYVASTYEKQVDRDLFISTFLRWAHDKPDLTEMEVDQMISAAEETVNVASIGRSIQKMEKYHEAIMDGEEVDDNGKKKRFGMVEVEQINAIRTKYDQAKGRLKTLMEGLETTRSKRMADVKDRNSSILNLFEAWQKDETTRNELIALGKKEKDEDKAEVGRIRDLDDMTSLVSGQTEEEAGS